MQTMKLPAIPNVKKPKAIIFPEFWSIGYQLSLVITAQLEYRIRFEH